MYYFPYIFEAIKAKWPQLAYIVDKITNALIDKRFCFCNDCSTMRTALILAGIIGIAVGQGYYHQEYNYKTSSSAYKNNELQHKTDDQGFYSKDGDLEGRVRPKVKSNSEHSEYVNPKLGQGSSGKFSFYIDNIQTTIINTNNFINTWLSKNVVENYDLTKKD